MESLPALPPELAAVVGPSVRGAAPLLAPVGSDDAAELGATPFELCLALLTPPLPSGEALPAAGNELPLAQAVAAGDTALNPPMTELMLALAPTAAAVQAQLRPAEPPPVALTAEASLAPALPVGNDIATNSAMQSATAAQSLSSAEQPPAVAQAQMLAEPSALAPFDSAAATAESALANDPGEPLVPDSAAQRATKSASLDGQWADEQRVERSVAQRPEPRASVAPALPQPTALPQYQAVAVAAASTAEAGAVVQSAARRVELQQIVQAAGASVDGAGVPLTDWLPSAGSTGNTSHAASAPTQGAPGTPVDTRSPTWQEAFASRVQWLVDHAVGEAHIKLNPPELGAVDVKISLIDDKTFVQLTTATVGARDELHHSLPRLRELFAGSGLELGGASVQSGGDGQRPADGDGQRAGGRAADGRGLAPLSTVTSEPRVASLGPSLGRIDVFA